MDNRVNYLSDKLVHLRGGLKSPQEVMEPAAAASAGAASADRRAMAEAHRRVQIEEIYTDYQQRMTRRRAQLEALQSELTAQCERAGILKEKLDARLQALPALRPAPEAASSASALGEAYRAIDAERLDYFTLDAECERLLTAVGGKVAEPERRTEPSFAERWKNGWALALSLGAVVALAILIAALILFAAWR